MSQTTPNSTHTDILGTWTTEDLIEFNRDLIVKKEVRCEWVDHGTCNDIVKGKDFTAHLYHKHGVTSNSQLYLCRWHECSSAPMKKSSLGRHTMEQHTVMKWLCPHCPLWFAREGVMRGHMGRMHGDA